MAPSCGGANTEPLLRPSNPVADEDDDDASSASDTEGGSGRGKKPRRGWVSRAIFGKSRKGKPRI